MSVSIFRVKAGKMKLVYDIKRKIHASFCQTQEPLPSKKPKKKRKLFNPARLAAKRKKKSRDNQTEEEKLHERESNRIRHAEKRANETAEETELRRTRDRLRAAARRKNETLEEKNKRRMANRIRAIKSRAIGKQMRQEQWDSNLIICKPEPNIG